MKNRFGGKNTVCIGLILLTVTTFGEGAIAHIHNPRTFKYVAVGLRFFQG